MSVIKLQIICEDSDSCAPSIPHSSYFLALSESDSLVAGTGCKHGSCSSSILALLGFSWLFISGDKTKRCRKTARDSFPRFSFVAQVLSMCEVSKQSSFMCSFQEYRDTRAAAMISAPRHRKHVSRAATGKSCRRAGVYDSQIHDTRHAIPVSTNE